GRMARSVCGGTPDAGCSHHFHCALDCRIRRIAALRFDCAWLCTCDGHCPDWYERRSQLLSGSHFLVAVLERAEGLPLAKSYRGLSSGALPMLPGAERAALRVFLRGCLIASRTPHFGANSGRASRLGMPASQCRDRLRQPPVRQRARIRVRGAVCPRELTDVLGSAPCACARGTPIRTLLSGQAMGRADLNYCRLCRSVRRL